MDYISVIVLCFRYSRLVVCTQAVTWTTLVLLCYVLEPSFSGMYAGCHVDYISVIVLCFRYPRLVVSTQDVTWIASVWVCFLTLIELTRVWPAWLCTETVMIIHLMAYFSEVTISLERFITTKFM